MLSLKIVIIIMIVIGMALTIAGTKMNDENDMLFNVFMIGVFLGALLTGFMSIAIEAYDQAQSQRQHVVLPKGDQEP